MRFVLLMIPPGYESATPGTMPDAAPFPAVREVIGGYWMIRTASREDAIAWAARCPALPGETIEVRRVPEMEDFTPEIRSAVEQRGAAQSS